jgi:hypothetical protein
MKSKVHEALHYAVSITPLLPAPSQDQITSSTPYSLTPSAYVPPSMWATKFHTPIYIPTGKITVLYISLFIFLDSKLEDKRFWIGRYRPFSEFTCALNFFMKAILNCEDCSQIFELFITSKVLCYLSFCFDFVAHSVCVLLYSSYAFTQ